MDQSICNICGANYEYHNGRWKCPACGAYKPEETSNEELTLMFVADQKRRLGDFEEAERAYTDIIEKYPQNPYGYWGRLLCKHGIKYEKDYNGKMIPTCCAPTIESLYTDKDCLWAIDYADADTKRYFTSQAEYIERIRTIWLEKASKEKPYDIFICYKDSDLANGINRTQDSIEAQEIYMHLVAQGYRVFFSRESLRDKVGEKYEPYIFNALSTAKVMLVYGKSSEYITSTWLKNEWTRYLKMIGQGLKKTNSLIIAYDGFSPSELPTSLSSMQCLDASRKTFFHDLDNEIKEIINASQPHESANTYTSSPPSSINIEKEQARFDAFVSQINELNKERRSIPKSSSLTKLYTGVSNEVDEDIAKLIKTYQLPESIEILTAFILYAVASVDLDTYNLLSPKANNLNNSRKQVDRAWMERIEEAYQKVKTAYGNSDEFYKIDTVYKKLCRKIKRQKIKFPAFMIGAFLPWIIALIVIICLEANNTSYNIPTHTNSNTTNLIENNSDVYLSNNDFISNQDNSNIMEIHSNNRTTKENDLFSEGTYELTKIENFSFCIPNYWNEEGSKQEYMQFYAEKGDAVAMLSIAYPKETESDYDVTFEGLYADNQNMLEALPRMFFGNGEIVKHEVIENDHGIKGILYHVSFRHKIALFKSIDATGYCFCFPSSGDRRWFYVILTQTDNINNTIYKDDFFTIISAIKPE